MTVAIISPVFQARSWNGIVNDPLPVKVCPEYEARVSLAPVNLATTFPLVKLHELGVYNTLAVGGILSIQVTVAVADQVFHRRSQKVNVNDPLSVKVYPVAESPVIGSLNQVMITVTF